MANSERNMHNKLPGFSYDYGTNKFRFYTAKVYLVLKYFHKKNIIYRDLKLDNIFLIFNGHIKITNYGFCKKNV
jgi:serine/threonine protein kinase